MLTMEMLVVLFTVKRNLLLNQLSLLLHPIVYMVFVHPIFTELDLGTVSQGTYDAWKRILCQGTALINQLDTFHSGWFGIFRTAS